MLTLLFALGVAWCAYWLVRLVLDWGHRTSLANDKTLCSECQSSLNEKSATTSPSTATNADVKPVASASAEPVTSASVKPVASASAEPVASNSVAPSASTRIAANDDANNVASSVTPTATKTVEVTSAAAAPVAQSSATSNVVPLFTAPAEKDDLKTIKGIGVVMEKTLNDLGITTFKQLAAFQQAEVKMVSDKLSEAKNGFGDRIERDEWVDQAKGLVKKAS